MSRTVKKMTAILLSVILLTTIFTALPFTASAASSGTTGGCTWTLDDNGTLTISGNGYMDSYLSKDTPWGKDITALIIEDGVKDISNYAFADCTKLKSAKIGNSVKSIYMYAFENCTALETIEFSDSIEFISSDVFNKTAWFNNQPDGLVYAGKVAYKYKGKMAANTTINILDGTKSIGAGAFSYCKNLVGITIPNSVTAINQFAFQETSLINVTIPDSVTSIDSYLFYNCKLLENVTLGNKTTSINNSSFLNCINLVSIDIPDNVISIGADAFKGCRRINSVTIPSSVNTIGAYAVGYDEWKNKKTGFTICGVKDSAAEKYANDNGFTFIPINDEPTEPATEPTTVEPTTEPAPAVMVGDVNGDDVVNGADAGILNRYTSGWKGYESKIKSMTAADINGDGNINGADAGILARYTSGWKQYDKFFV